MHLILLILETFRSIKLKLFCVWYIAPQNTFQVVIQKDILFDKNKRLQIVKKILFDRFLISIETNYQKWCDFEYSDAEKFKYTPDNPSLVGIETGSPDFSDSWEIRTGFEYRLSKNINLMAGYHRAISPVPDQSGRVSNYIDMDQHIFSLGAGYSLDLPVTITGLVKYHMPDDLTVTKDRVQGFTWQDQEPYSVDIHALINLSAFLYPFYL